MLQQPKHEHQSQLTELEASKQEFVELSEEQLERIAGGCGPDFSSFNPGQGGGFDPSQGFGGFNPGQGFGGFNPGQGFGGFNPGQGGGFNPGQGGGFNPGQGGGFDPSQGGGQDGGDAGSGN